MDGAFADDVNPEDQLSLMDEVEASSGVLSLATDVPASGAGALSTVLEAALTAGAPWRS